MNKLYQEENKGCQYMNCGKPTFSKRIEGKKVYKITCPQHEGMLNEIQELEKLAEPVVVTNVDEKKEATTLAEMEIELERLKEKIAEAKRIEEERIKAEELAKPAILTVLDLNVYGDIIIKFSKMNDYILNTLRQTRGRQYNAYNETNTIPVSEWNVFKASIQELHNKLVCNIEWKYSYKSLEEEIDNYINESDVDVNDNGKEFVLTIARRRKMWVVEAIANKLPGFKIVQPTKEIKNYRINVPLSEGWRLGSVLDEFVKFKYIENYNIAVHSNGIILEQIESRRKLDGAAQLEDVENFPDLDLNGQTLRNFQKVGVRFACLALGLGDIAK